MLSAYPAPDVRICIPNSAKNGDIDELVWAAVLIAQAISDNFESQFLWLSSTCRYERMAVSIVLFAASVALACGWYREVYQDVTQCFSRNDLKALALN